jgi:hypothetical protein
MNMEPWGQNAASTQAFTSLNRLKPEDNNAVLFELFQLLEDYAPAWYTEEHHNRAAAALEELLSQSLIC